MANLFEMMGSSARMEPIEQTARGLIARPFMFIVLMVIISVTTNMMPFYSDGSRMNLLDGVAVVLQDKGKMTSPYEVPKSGPSYTKVKNKRKPLNRNGITEVGYLISEVFKVDVYTGFILFICMIGMFYSLVIEFNQYPFNRLEVKLYKDAFNPKISNNEFAGSYKKGVVPAYLSTLVLSTIVSLGFPTLLFNFGKDKIGLFFHPILLIFVAIFMVKVFFYAGKSKAFHGILKLRRCPVCFHMDSHRITNKEYVETVTTTRDHYYLNSDGSRGKTFKSESSKHDVHNYEIVCDNCGDVSTLKI